MKRSLLLSAALVAASAAGAQQSLVGWDSPAAGAPPLLTLVRAQAAPAPAAAPKAAASCPDGRALEGRAMKLTLFLSGADKPLVLKLAYDSCALEYPRDEPPAPPYTIRRYKSADGASLGVYSGSDRATSTVSLRLADGASSASMIPALTTAALASGQKQDLGEILLVRLTDGGRDGVVIHARGEITSVAN